MDFNLTSSHKLLFSFLFIFSIFLEGSNNHAVGNIVIDESNQISLKENLHLSLISIIEEGDINKVKYLIDGGVEISSKNRYDKKPLLHYAIDHLEVVNFLIEKGLNVNATDATGNTVLHNFIENPEVVRAFVNAKVDVNAEGRHGNMPLHFAARNPEATKILIEAGANPNAKDKFDGTPLHYVRDAETARHLIAAGAKVKALSHRNNEEIHQLDNKDFAEFLTRGADQIEKYGLRFVIARKDFRITPLHNAVSPELAQLLIDHGADIEAQTDNLETPLHFAIERGDIKVAEVLIAAGANVNAKNHHAHQTPLHLAQSAEAVTLLVNAGAKVDAKNSFGRTPLHHLRNPEVVRALIDKEADIFAKDNKGRTALQLAKSRTDFYIPSRQAFTAHNRNIQILEILTLYVIHRNFANTIMSNFMGCNDALQNQ